MTDGTKNLISEMATGHYVPRDISDRIALGFVKTMRFIADRFFAKRYGHRVVVV